MDGNTYSKFAFLGPCRSSKDLRKKHTRQSMTECIARNFKWVISGGYTLGKTVFLFCKHVCRP